jgi:valyl-tRNA synthetase
MDGYRFNDATSAVYEFFWNDFCDWYIEASKLGLSSQDEQEKNRTVSILMYVLEESLRMLHPFLPFLTEEIFQKLPQVSDEQVVKELGYDTGRALIAETFPSPEAWRDFAGEAQAFEILQDLIRKVRTLRSEFTVPPTKKIRFAVRFEDGFHHRGFFESHRELISLLTSADSVVFVADKPDTSGALAAAGVGFEAYVYIREYIDVDAAVARLQKSIEKESKALDGIEKRLGNEAFLANAKPEYIEQEQQRRQNLSELIAKMEGYIEELQA